MSNKEYALSQLGLTKAEAKKVISTKPASDLEVFYMPEIRLYYRKSMDKRKNASVYCLQIDKWRTSARYNTELDDTSMFIPVSKIESALQG